MEGNSQLSSAKENPVSFALIIDGESLGFALNKYLKKSFLELAIGCASVICCRSSPKQKALVCLVNPVVGSIELNGIIDLLLLLTSK